MAEINTENMEKVSGGATTQKYIRYTIQSGDTLWAISQKYDTDVDTLVKLNNIKDRNKIYPNQVILVPVKG